jgi:hypothetical protein
MTTERNAKLICSAYSRSWINHGETKETKPGSGSTRYAPLPEAGYQIEGEI